VLDDNRRGRVAIPSYSLSEMVEHISGHHHEVYEKCRVWRSLAIAAGDTRSDIQQYMVNRAKVPPNSMKVVKVRYAGVGQISEDAMFAVRLIKHTLSKDGEWDFGMNLKYVQAWEPEDGGSLCRGHPTVTVYNHTSEWLVVQPNDIIVEVCPMQEVVRYVSDCGGANRAVSEKIVNAGVSEKGQIREVERPPQYPEELWDLVSPEDKRKVAAEFLRFPEPRLRQCIDDLYYKSDVFADRRTVDVHPWIQRSIQIAEKRVEIEAFQGINAMDTEGMASQTGEAGNAGITGDPRIAKEPQDNALYGSLIVQGAGTEKPEAGSLPQIGTRGAVADNSETNKSEEQSDLAEKRVIDFF
jgi:hypothetical protein